MVADICHKFRRAFWRDSSVAAFVRQLLNLCTYTGYTQVCILFDADGQLDHHCPLTHIPRLAAMFPQITAALQDSGDSGYHHYENSPSTIYTTHRVAADGHVPVYVVFTGERLYATIVNTTDLQQLVPIL